MALVACARLADTRSVVDAKTSRLGYWAEDFCVAFETRSAGYARSGSGNHVGATQPSGDHARDHIRSQRERGLGAGAVARPTAD